MSIVELPTGTVWSWRQMWAKVNCTEVIGGLGGGTIYRELYVSRAGAGVPFICKFYFLRFQ